MNEPLKTDPSRSNMKDATGIYVRAQSEGIWASVDIAELDTASLNIWLTSRGGSNPWAENVVLLLLGHKP